MLHYSETYLADRPDTLNRLVGQEWDIVIDVPQPERVEPRFLHAVVSAWVDRGEHPTPDRTQPTWTPGLASHVDHDGPDKTFSIGPLWLRPDGRSGFALRLLGGTLTPPAHTDPHHTQSIRLGDQAATIDWGASQTLGSLRFRDLLDTPTVSSVLLRFETPMTRRRGGIYLPSPSEQAILYSWERAASALGLDGTIDWAKTPARIVHLNGHTASWPAPKARSRKHNPIGFVGDIAIAAPQHLGRRLHQLARIASYTGTGAHTTFGMGFTTLMSVENPATEEPGR